MTLLLQDYRSDLPAGQRAAPCSQILDASMLPYVLQNLTREEAQVTANISTDHHQSAELLSSARIWFSQSHHLV